MSVIDDRTNLAANLRLQAFGCRALGSNFYGNLLDRMAADAEAGGIVWKALAAHAAAPFEAVYPLRLLGGVHRLVLGDEAPDLARHFPTMGGDGNAEAAWQPFCAVLADREEALARALTLPPQTNEVGRSVALLAGLVTIWGATRLPVRLLEVGASAGLNLLLDRYRYEQDGFAWGDPASRVRFLELWQGLPPPLDDGLAIVDGRGCDQAPIDLSEPGAGRTLMSYVWPGQSARFDLLKGALDIAAGAPPQVDRANAIDWLPAQLSERQTSVVTVVWHSIFWQYLAPTDQRSIRDAIALAGERATTDAPLAWLRLEPAPEMVPVELRLTFWPGGIERLLATGEYHVGPIRWQAG